MGDLTSGNLKIGFDAKRACVNQVGLGSYSRNIIKAIQENKPKSECLLFSPKEPLDKYKSLLKHPQTRLLLPKYKNSIYGNFWRYSKVANLSEKLGVDLFHGLSHVLPKGLTVPSVVTFHDLIFLHHPEWFGYWNVKNYYKHFLRSAREADHIISISEATKQDLVDKFSISPDKITVTYQSCNSAFKKIELGDESKSVLNKLGLEVGKYFLFVGTLEKRKNAYRLTEAYSKLSRSFQKEYPLIFVGKETKEAQRVKDLVKKKNLENNVRFLSYVEFETLIILMNFSKAITYPALIEGFGLPVLEGMSCGTPVLTSNCSSLKEVGGESAYLVDPYEVDSLKLGLELIIQNQDLYDLKKQSIASHIQKFSVKETLEAVLGVYNSVLGTR